MAGTKTTVLIPAAAPAAESAVAAFPFEAAATVSYPYSIALATTRCEARSFVDPEGFRVSSFRKRRGMASASRRRGTGRSGVPPAAKEKSDARKYFYSLKTMAEFKGKILDNGLEGLHMTINDKEVYFRLIGEFNAYNLLAVYGAAICLDEDKDKVLQALSSLEGAEGRFDYRISKKDKITGIVDYAHTPDALLNVLATIKKLRRGNEKIITVVGCGGDRDKTKRPVMAEVACEYSDKVIFTSDNPRSEDPLAILKDMEAGLTVVTKKKAISIADRKEAIKTAVNLAGKDDIILVAGKGHEKYQDIKGVKHEFDDKQVLNEMFEMLEK